MFKKRKGTSGIRGQFYETKLLSLLLYRARHNDDVEEFHLASNVHGIGTFDDICFRAKVRGFDRPISVFIQSKHRENNKALTLDNKTDLRDYFESYLKIRRTFKKSQQVVLFNGEFDETECLFVLYTNTKYEQNKKKLQDKFRFLNDLIGTDGSGGFHPFYNDEHIESLCKVAVNEQITLLAITIAKFINKADFQRILSDELVLRYHVILAQRIMLISDVQPAGHRVATFRDDFFTSNAEFITTFKKTLFLEVLKNRKVDEKTIILYLSVYTMEAPSPENLSKLIGSVITYNNKHGKLEFINNETADELKQQLYQVDICKSIVDTAIDIAAKEILSSMSFKVPAAFGNKDITIGGNDNKIEKKLDDLTSRIYYLLLKSQPSNKVTIDNSLPKEFLKLNGGMAGAVGNILVPAEKSQLMKFTDDTDSLGELARRLIKKLTVKIQDLEKYRFEVKDTNFPKLSFQYSEYDKNMAEDFLNKLIFYTNQADENIVEETLKNEIEDRQYNIVKHCFRIKMDAIFSSYHTDIQKWWLSPDRYLTKYTDFLDKAISNIIEEPLVSLVNVICRKKIQHIDYTFKEDALSSIKFDVPLNTIIITDTIHLTVAKILSKLKNKDHILLDLEYFLNLPINESDELCAEITTSKNKQFIFVCENVLSYRNETIFRKIAKAVHEKMTVIVTNRVSAEIIQKYLPQTVDLVYDVKNNLTCMSEESIKTLLKKCTVDFQDKKISLDLIIDDESTEFVEGDILNRMINEETIGKLGKSLKTSNYEEMEHLYINRHIRCSKELKLDGTPKANNGKLMETLNDIADEVVFITAKPGMGKSTLLTHISLETKRIDPTIWVVRINLLEYATEFKKWKDKTNIDSLETLKFLCYAVLNMTDKHEKANKVGIELEESNGNVRVSLKEYTGDQWTVFEFKMFLQFYNRRRIIFIFDGFDEICPHYMNAVKLFLKSVQSFPRKHKMWITSRSYNDIISILEREFGISYELLNLTPIERRHYLEKFWKHNLILKEFDDKQIENVYDFYKNIKELLVSDFMESPLLQIYLHALEYLMTEYPKPFDYTDRSMEGLLAAERLKIYYKQFGGSTGVKIDSDSFVGTPLNLYLLADIFQNEIKDVTKKTNKWNLDINTFTIYERFLETKLKIRFQEKKRKTDICDPDDIIIFEDVRADLIAKHKKVAAYVIFHGSIHTLFSREELEEINSIIKLMKKGWEKTGIIYSVTSDNIPIFVHRSIAEYFAVVYICDQLKKEKCNEKQEKNIYFMFNIMFLESSANVRYILHSVLKMDDALMNVLQRNGKIIFQLLMVQTKACLAEKETNELYEIKKKHALNLALRDNLNKFVTLFVSILKSHLQENDLDNFIEIIKKTSMFKTALRFKCEEFITSTLDIVRKVDPFKFNDLFSSPTLSPCVNLCLRNNEEILEMCRHIVDFPTFRDVEYYMYDTDRDIYVCLITSTYDKVRYPGIHEGPFRYMCKKMESKYATVLL